MKLLLLHLSIFFSILFTSLPSSQSCTANDKNALLEIKKSLNNHPLLSSWNPQTDCCTGWSGVECTYGRVTYLTLSSKKFSGNIPPAVTKLRSLDTLFFKYSNFSGPIPDNISDLKNLTYLGLSENQLTGPIPGSLSQMPKLLAIHVNDNKLTGSIPNSFGSFVGNVPGLELSNNRLSGKIPESLSKHDFNVVFLSGNSFVGDGSMFFGRNKTTIQVDLSRNKFQFDLSKVKFARSILTLDLSQNQIFGKIPQQLTNLRLERFNVSYNRLCGKIPRGGFLQTSEPSAFSHNLCLCGIPLVKAC
ncbi:hypothetical protein CARUB_v10014263mg [Capsella rubella]|uniref:Leucine-rich repeat-containing N-terminal plant-type domain-containing protein n=1 Tax=Capsella rubella TaxID=81985 RepID=R0HZT5_9BRAS|nr:leucine-rich repeat protein FLOR 1 [Capsella rubella]EOA31110.1 hypothetical protein CARUB_v10014263mg [Capsella rubella]